MINHFRGVFNDFGMFGNFGEHIHPTGVSDDPRKKDQIPPFMEQFMQRQCMPIAEAAMSILSDIQYLVEQRNRWFEECYYGEMYPSDRDEPKGFDPSAMRDHILSMLFNSSQTDHYYED